MPVTEITPSCRHDEGQVIGKATKNMKFGNLCSGIFIVALPGPRTMGPRMKPGRPEPPKVKARLQSGHGKASSEDGR